MPAACPGAADLRRGSNELPANLPGKIEADAAEESHRLRQCRADRTGCGGDGTDQRQRRGWM